MSSETRQVKLPNGMVLEMEIMPGFYEKVRERFNLDDGATVDDDHLRMFVYGACKHAIDAAEAGANDGTKHVEKLG